MAHIKEIESLLWNRLLYWSRITLTARSRVILWNLIASHLLKNTLHFTELEISLMCSQQFTTRPCFEPDKPSRRLSLLFLLPSILILRFLDCALLHTYVISTNKMHTFYSNVLIQSQCLRRFSNIEVFILRKTCTCIDIIDIVCTLYFILRQCI